MNGSEIMAARRENEIRHHIATLQQLLPDLDAAAVMAAESEVFRRLVAELVRIRDEEAPLRALADCVDVWNTARLEAKSIHDAAHAEASINLHEAFVVYANAARRAEYRRTQDVHDDEAAARAVRHERHARWVAARRNGGTAA